MATGTPLKVKFKVTCNAATDEDRVVEIPGDLTVAQIKKKHFATELGERCRIRFIHQGRELSEGETVEDCWRRSGLPHVGCVQKRGQTGRTSAPSSSSSSSSTPSSQAKQQEDDAAGETQTETAAEQQPLLVIHVHIAGLTAGQGEESVSPSQSSETHTPADDHELLMAFIFYGSTGVMILFAWRRLTEKPEEFDLFSKASLFAISFVWAYVVASCLLSTAVRLLRSACRHFLSGVDSVAALICCRRRSGPSSGTLQGEEGNSPGSGTEGERGRRQDRD